jgi:hypothetical protein
MIDRHYGHLARDGCEHAIRLLDALSAGQRPRWTLVDAAWTSKPAATASVDNKALGETRSPLTDSNRRPLLTMRCDRQPVATDGNGFGVIPPFSRLRDLPPLATGCSHGAP